METFSLSKPASSLIANLSETSRSVPNGPQMNAADTELYNRVLAYASDNRKVSRTILQREFKIGGVKAVWLMDMLDAAGIATRPTPASKEEVGDGRSVGINTPPEHSHRLLGYGGSANSLHVNLYLVKLLDLEKVGISFWTIKDDEILLKVHDISAAQLFLEKNSHLLFKYYGIFSYRSDKYCKFQFSPFDTRELDFFERGRLLYGYPSTYIAIPDKTDEYDALRDALFRALESVLHESPLSPNQQAELIGETIRKVEDLRSANATSIVSRGRADFDASPMPATPPALWVQDRGKVPDSDTGRQRLENAGEFTRRVYGPWLGKGMTRNLLRKLDNSLLQALYRTYGTNLPDDIPLPTKKDENSLWVARVEEEGLTAVIPEGSPEFVLKEAQRLLSARQRRNRDKT